MFLQPAIMNLCVALVASTVIMKRSCNVKLQILECVGEGGVEGYQYGGVNEDVQRIYFRGNVGGIISLEGLTAVNVIEAPDSTIDCSHLKDFTQEVKLYTFKQNIICPPSSEMSSQITEMPPSKRITLTQLWTGSHDSHTTSNNEFTDVTKKITEGVYVCTSLTTHDKGFGNLHDEPHCLSQFDYGYKVLNRLILLENEIRLLTETVQRQEIVIDMFRNQISGNPSVAFMAELTTSLDGKNHRIYFDHVKLNLGNAYRPHHGLFIAPTNGTYQFAVAACSRSGHYVVLEMKVNDGIVGKMLAGDTAYDSCNSKVFLADLKSGDDVFVQHGNVGDYLLANEAYGYPSFSGVLLQTT